jgi:hypothetical protein
MRKMIIWTAEERQKIATSVMAQMCFKLKLDPANATEDTFLKYKKFFIKIVVPAMESVFINQPDKLRSLKQWNDVPWLLNLLMDLVDGSKKERDEDEYVPEKALPAFEDRTEDDYAVKEFDRKQPFQEKVDSKLFEINMSAKTETLESLAHLIGPLIAPIIAQQVVSLLASQYRLTPLSYMEKHAAETSAAVREKVSARTKILIYGLLPAQQHDVSTAWSHKYNIVYKGSDKAKSIANEVLNGCEFAIGVTNFMNHAMDKRLHTHFKKNYVRVTGGVSAVKKSLADLWAKQHLPAKLETKEIKNGI